MSTWTVVDGISADAARAFANLDSVFALEGEPIAQDPLSEVIRVERGGHVPRPQRGRVREFGFWGHHRRGVLLPHASTIIAPIPT